MRKNLVALLALGLLAGNGVAAQESSTITSANHGTEEMINHRVALGETVVLIAKKYVIRPSDIYEFNSDAVEGINPGMVLKIPVGRSLSTKDNAKPQLPVKEKTAHPVAHAPAKPQPIEESHAIVVNEEPQKADVVVAVITEPVPPQPAVLPNNGVFEVKHQVTSGETLTSLSRRYNTTVEAITDANKAKLKHGLQTGQELVIPAGPTPETVEGVIVHDVQSGETLMGLARKYNTTVEAITEYNKRKLKHGLQTGQKLSIMPGQPE